MNTTQKYPTEWQLGKARGSITEFPTSFRTTVSRSGKKQEYEFFRFANNDNNKELTLQKANEYLMQESIKFNMVRNRIRWINKDTIEVELTQGKTMKIDAKFLDKVQENHLEVKKKAGKTDKYYVVCHDGNKTFAFTNLICTYNKIEYINSNTLDLRSENLREKIKKETPKKVKKVAEPKPTDATNQFYSQFIKLVKDNGGKFKDPDFIYVNSHEELDVICKYGHEFKICLNNVKRGSWCHECNTYTYNCIIKCAVEHLLGYPFDETTFDWLKDSDKSLTLDAYNKDYNLTVEFRGVQHNIYVKSFHKTKEESEVFLKSVKVKDGLCKDNGVEMITVSYSIEIENVCEYIWKALVKLGYDVNKDKVKSFDISSRKEIVEETGKLKKLIEVNNGKLISGYALSNDSLVTIKLDNELILTNVDSIKKETFIKVVIPEKVRMIEHVEVVKEKKSQDITHKKCIYKDCDRKGQDLPVSEFNPKKDMADGLQPYCRLCFKKISTEYRKKSKLVKTAKTAKSAKTINK